MAKQLLVNYQTFEITPQQINESLAKNGGKLIGRWPTAVRRLAIHSGLAGLTT